tara:strand:+ start:90 stop:341 length:252 start_codon:yes stop_codon:yes gene_type:complete
MFDKVKEILMEKLGMKYMKKGLLWLKGKTDGKKAYLGILVFLIDGLGDFLNAEISPDEFSATIWKAFMLFASRSAMKKAEKPS